MKRCVYVKKFVKGCDFLLVVIPILLASFGIVMIYSASMVTAVVAGLESPYYMIKQLQWFVLGLVVFFICLLIPYKIYRNKKIVMTIVFVSLISLLLVYFFGETQYNATRTISILGFNVQPSEFVKLGLIVYLASVYSKKQAYIENFKNGVFPPIILTLLMVGLIVIQPDLGTATIIMAIVSMIIMSSGIRMKHIMLLGILAVGFILMLIPVLITEKRIARFTGAYNPFTNPDSEGYHLIQSYLAIGGGGVTGEGLGQSVQKLGYLWGSHTDFIMSIIAEELGIGGVVLVIGFIFLITLRGLYFAKKCSDSLGTLLAVGISSMIGIQAIINLGAISGILPITGVTLPFISYGGSSLLVLMISMGILNNIARTVNLKDQEPKVIESQSIHNYRHRSGKTWPI